MDKSPELTTPWRLPGGEEAVRGVHGYPRDTKDVVWEGQGPRGRAHFSPLHLRDEDFLLRRQEELSYHGPWNLTCIRRPHYVYQSFSRYYQNSHLGSMEAKARNGENHCRLPASLL